VRSAPPGTFRVAACAAVALVGCGCTVTAIPPTAADRNRELVVELENEVDQLRRRTAELEAALAAASRLAVRPGDVRPLDSEVLAAAPFAIGLELGRFGGPIDADGDGRPERLRLHVRPLDARRETVQVAGTATVEVFLIDDGQSAPVGTARLGPLELRDAFRSGLMGSHYTIDVPIDSSSLGRDGRETLVARVVVVDGLTGRVLTAEALHTVPPTGLPIGLQMGPAAGPSEAPQAEAPQGR
jgi:hypothetical protein